MRQNSDNPNADKLIIYFNGLGDGEHHFKEDLVLLSATRFHRYPSFRMKTNWYSEEPYEQQLKNKVELVRGYLIYASLILIGASAGVSDSINVYGQIAQEIEASNGNQNDLHLIGLCGRTAAGQLNRFDPRTLKRMSRTSLAFRESVTYCEEVTVPRLTDTHKQNMFLVHHPLDELVPAKTQTIEGVPERKIYMPEHGFGILRSGFLIPKIIKQQLAA